MVDLTDTKRIQIRLVSELLKETSSQFRTMNVSKSVSDETFNGMLSSVISKLNTTSAILEELKVKGTK